MKIVTFNSTNFIFSLIQYKLLKKYYNNFSEYIVYTNNQDIYEKIKTYGLNCIIIDDINEIDKENNIWIESNIFITDIIETEEFKNINLNNTIYKFIEEENIKIYDEVTGKYFIVLDYDLINVINIYDYINRLYNDLTIFYITFNRTDTMIRTLNSYKKFFTNTNFNIVIINNGSDNIKTIELLDEYKKEYKIYDKKCICELNDLDKNIDEVIGDYTNKKNNIKYYAVCDTDICFSKSDTETLNIYMQLCNKLDIGVGPELEIKDIPNHYLLKYYVIRISFRNLLSPLINKIDIDGHTVSYTYNPIDTTFVLFKKDNVFKRLKRQTIRVLEPYNVQHLDWYINFFEPSEEIINYMNKKSNIGSYGGSWIKSTVNLLKSNISNEEKINLLVEIIKDKPVKDHSLEHYILSNIYANGYLGEKNIDLAKEYLLNAAPEGASGTEQAPDTYKCLNHNLFEMCFEDNFEWINN